MNYLTTEATKGCLTESILLIITHPGILPPPHPTFLFTHPLPSCSAVPGVIPNPWISLQTLQPERRNAASLVPALLQSRNWSNRRMRISRARWCYTEGLGENFPSPALLKCVGQGWLFPNLCSDRLLQESCRGWAALWQPPPGLR